MDTDAEEPHVYDYITTNPASGELPIELTVCPAYEKPKIGTRTSAVEEPDDNML